MRSQDVSYGVMSCTECMSFDVARKHNLNVDVVKKRNGETALAEKARDNIATP